jgi:hypothetical protein
VVVVAPVVVPAVEAVVVPEVDPVVDLDVVEELLVPLLPVVLALSVLL